MNLNGVLRTTNQALKDHGAALSKTASSFAAATITGAGGQSSSQPPSWPIPPSTVRIEELPDDPSDLFKDSVEYKDQAQTQPNEKTSFHNIDNSATNEPGPDPEDDMKMT